jgi:hypothetical protein
MPAKMPCIVVDFEQWGDEQCPRCIASTPRFRRIIDHTTIDFVGRHSAKVVQDAKRRGTLWPQRAATQKRLRDKVEEKTPDAKTQREEDGKEAKRNFFKRGTARQSLPSITCPVNRAEHQLSQ